MSTYNKNHLYLNEIKNKPSNSKNLEIIQLDILNFKKIKSLFRKIEKKGYDNINLINLSSLDIGRKNLEDIYDDEIVKIINTNLTSTILLTKYFQEFFKPKVKNKFNKIIHIASEAGISGGHNISIYAASKGGVITFVKAISRELFSKNILINSISPGAFLSGKNKLLSKKDQIETAKNIPLGYLGKPIELSDIIFSLLKTTNLFKGINIRVNGGKF